MTKLPIAFAQKLANKLHIGSYSLGETLSFHSRNAFYTPDIIIYKGEKPYVIIELKDKSSHYERILNKFFIEINRAQDYFKIEWNILTINENEFYLRRLDGKNELYSNLDEIVDIIKRSVNDNVPFSIGEDHIKNIKSILNSAITQLPLQQQEKIHHFLINLKLTDFIIENEHICFIPQKENDFFQSLLVPIVEGNICRYTSSSSLFTLLKSCNQNMLSLNCMNDISEIDYADKYINLDTIILDNNVKESNDVFILSCCDELMSDDLMMWRLYAQNAEGVNLKYHIYEKLIDYDYFYLAKVSYGENPDSHSTLDFLQKLFEWNYKEMHFKFNKWMIWKHFFKSYHFRYENEVRLIYHEHNKSRATDTIWVEDKNSGIYSPMKLFDLRKSMGSKFPLGLIGIKLGPRNKEAIINRIQIETMYNKAKIYCPGIRPDINISDINIYR